MMYALSVLVLFGFLLFVKSNPALKVFGYRYGGDGSTLYCRTSPNEVRPDNYLSVVWKKDGVVYEPDGDRVRYHSEVDVIIFQYLLPEDEGNWTCSIGDVTSEALVLDAPASEKTTHVFHEFNSSFFVNCNVELGRVTKKNGIYDVTWQRKVITDDPAHPIEFGSLFPSGYSNQRQRNNESPVYGPDGRHIFYPSNFTLLVNNFNLPNPENVSLVQYICIVRVYGDGGTTYNGMTMVNVSFVPPNINCSPPAVIVGNHGESVTLSVRIRSFPRPDIVWQVKNTTLNAVEEECVNSNHGRYVLCNERLENRNSISNLTIHNLRFEDSGPIQVHASMCNENDTAKTLLVVLPRIQSVNITCILDNEIVVLSYSVPPNFPDIITATDLSFQVELNFALMPEVNQDSNSTEDNHKTIIPAHVIKSTNHIVLETRRDIPAEVLKAVKLEGKRFRVQARLVLDNQTAGEWSSACSSAVFSRYEKCQLEEVDVKLHLDITAGSCPRLQMKTAMLAERLQSIFRERYLACEEFFLSTPILNCDNIDNTSADFRAKLKSHQAKVLLEHLDNKLQRGELDFINLEVGGEESIEVQVRAIAAAAINSESTDPPTQVSVPVIIIAALFGATLLVFIIVIVILIIVYRSKKRKNVEDVPKDLNNSAHADVERAQENVPRYVDLDALSTSRQSSINTSPTTPPDRDLRNGINSRSESTPNIPGREMASRPSTTSTTSTATTQLSTRTSRADITFTTRGEYVSLIGTETPIRSSNTKKKVVSQNIGKSSMVKVTPAILTDSQLPINLSAMAYRGYMTSSNHPQALIILPAHKTHRRVASDPSPMSEQVREELWLVGDEQADQNEEER